MMKNIKDVVKVNGNSSQSNIEVYIYNQTTPKDEYFIRDISEFNVGTNTETVLNSYGNTIWLPAITFPNRKTAVDLPSTAKTDVIILCKKIYTNSTHEPIGIACMYIPTDIIKAELSRIQLPAGGWSYYLDAKRNKVSGINSQYSTDAAIEEILGNNKLKTVSSRDILLMKKTTVNGGCLILSYPRIYLKNQIMDIARLTQIIILVAVFAAVLVSFLISRIITARLTRFTRNIEDMTREGTLSHSPVNGNDEIGLLNQRFNEIIEQTDFFLKQRYKANIKRKALEFELKQYQITPHFLYNTLSTIKWIGNRNGNNVIGEIIDSMVRFFRVSLNNGNEIISIASELDIIKEYVKIQLFTYDDNFEVEYNFEPDILEMFSIKLILQPIVENAILHGINDRNDSLGKIWISGKKDNGDILFVVEDNGVGMDESVLLELSEAKDDRKIISGYGMRSVRERICLLFGDSYGVSIDSKKDIGTKVTVKIPVCTKESLEHLLDQSFDD